MAQSLSDVIRLCPEKSTSLTEVMPNSVDCSISLINGEDFIVRSGWRSTKLCNLDGTPFDLFDALAQVSEGRCGDIPVLVVNGSKCPKLPGLPVRLIIVRKDASAIEQEHRRLRRSASKSGHKLDPKTLHAGEYMLLLTSLPQAEFTPDQIISLYRLRWQIELAFKRMKILTHFDKLLAKDVTAQVPSCPTCDAPTDRVQGPEQWVRRGFAVVPIATNRHPGWGVGANSPHSFLFSFPLCCSRNADNREGLNLLFLFSRGYGGGAPIAFLCPGQLKEFVTAQNAGLHAPKSRIRLAPKKNSVPWTSSMGWGNGKEEVGLCPTTRWGAHFLS